VAGPKKTGTRLHLSSRRLVKGAVVATSVYWRRRRLFFEKRSLVSGVVARFYSVFDRRDMFLTPVGTSCTGTLRRPIIGRQRLQTAKLGRLVARTAVPDSLEVAVAQAQEATRRALANSLRQLRLELDTSLGDETYSRLKQTLPFLRLLCLALLQSDESLRSSLRVLLPDEGAAAALRNDWKSEDQLSSVPVFSIESRVRRRELVAEAREHTVTCLAVTPRATEVDALQELARAANEHDSLRLIVLNPELIDMGATGLGLAARRLRDRLLNGLEPVYYLRTAPWGLVLRVYPDAWSVWIDRERYLAVKGEHEAENAANDDDAFVCIADDWQEQPTGDALADLVESFMNPEQALSGPLAGLMQSWRSLQRFLRALRQT